MLSRQLVAYLTDRGRGDSDGIRRAAHISTCSCCRWSVLRGLDADVAALPAVADIYALDVNGEYIAISEGRQTYMLSFNGIRYQLDVRLLGHIQGARRVTVVAEHRCGQPLTFGTLAADVKAIEKPTLIDPMELGKVNGKRS